jgi:hypothetical protein
MNTLEEGDPYQAVLSKLRGYAARLAIVLHLLKGAVRKSEETHVGPDTVADAWRLIGYLRSHLRRVHGKIQAGPGRERARRLADWLRRRRLKSFKNGDVLKGLSVYDNAKEVEDDLGLLEQLGYVRSRPGAKSFSSKGGRPPGPTYEVNPAWLATSEGDPEDHR